MKETRALAADLARIDDGPPVITLYLDLHWRDEQQRKRVRLFFEEELRKAKDIFSGAAEWPGLARTLVRLGAWVDRAVNQDIRPDAHGAMLVASDAHDLFLENLFGESVGPAMFIDSRPRLFPLIEMISLQRPVYIVALDSEGADVLDWRLGEVTGEHEVERVVPRRHHSGGWSQRHFERHIRRVIRRVWSECVALLEQLVIEPDADIILFGTEENLRAFERLLPQALTDRIIGMRPTPADRERIIEVARQVCDEERIAREFALVHRILGKGRSERSGTVGLDETLLALNESRVKLLALSRRFNPPGFRCTNCHSIWLTGASGCAFCGEATISTRLREEVCRRCLTDGGDLLVVPEGGPLDAYAGIGGLLRQVLGGERRQPVGRRQPEPSLMP